MRILSKWTTVGALWAGCWLAGCSRSDSITSADEKKQAPAREAPLTNAVSSPTNETQPSKLSEFDGEVRVNIDTDLKFVPQGWPLGLSVGQTSVASLRHRPYERLWKEPAYHSSDVLYGYFAFGNAPDNKFTFVVDDLDQTTWSLYVDANHNHDLTDDGPPLRNQGTGKFAATVSLDVEVITIAEERIHRPYRFWFWINEREGKATDSPDRVDQSKIPRLYAVCHYRGDVSIGGEGYSAIAFQMSRHNALYRESGLWIDLNRDGKLDKETEHFEDGAAIQVGGKEYQLRLDYP